MQRKFLTNLGLLLTLNLLVKPVWIFAIDRNVQNITGVVDYGFYFVVFNFSFLFNILLDLGITNFNNRNIAQNHQLLNKHFSAIVVLKFLLSLLYILVTFSVAMILGYKADQMRLLAWLGFNQILISLVLYLRSNISGLLLFKTDSLLSVLDRFLMILFCGILLWGNLTSAPFRIEWFVYSQTAAYSITALVALLVVVKKAQFRRLNFHFPFFLMIIKQSLPFALLVLLMTFYNRLDPVMLESLLDDEAGNQQAGIYASGFRLLDAANMIAYLFSVLLIPIFSKMIKNREPVEQMVRLAFTLIITFAVVVSVGCIVYSEEWMDLLYTRHIHESAAVFSLLMGGFIAVSTTYIFGTLLTANGNLMVLNIVSFLGLLINFLINLFLIPRLLAVGSAYASLTTQFFIAIVEVAIAQHIFRFRINYRFLVTLALFILGTVIFNLFIHQFDLNRIGIPEARYIWLFKLAAATLLSLALAWALNLLNLKSKLRILKEDR